MVLLQHHITYLFDRLSNNNESWECRASVTALRTHRSNSERCTNKVFVLVISLYRHQSWRWVYACNCERGKLWVRFPIEEIKYFYIVALVTAVLSSVTQHAMPSEFGRKWGMELSWWKQCNLIPGFQVPPAYSAKCGIFYSNDVVIDFVHFCDLLGI